MQRLEGRVGLALGSGAARGWAHIGVIRALEAAGIVPEIIAGSSVGAIVGGAYVSGHLDEFETWVRGLDRKSVLRNLDLSFRGGLFKGEQFFDFMSPKLPDGQIEALRHPFAAVATDLETGREVWLREGSLHAALRASVAMPGLITPTRRDGRWLVDGGLVNPVPVSLCRAMGAQTVIAVDLNATLLRRRLTPRRSSEEQEEHERRIEAKLGAPNDHESLEDAAEAPGLASIAGWAEEAVRLRTSIEVWAQELRDRVAGENESADQDLPSLYEVLANSLNIMQVRISRSRMAGDPADLLITPHLETFALLDLDRGGEAIEEGGRATNRALRAMSNASLDGDT